MSRCSRSVWSRNRLRLPVFVGLIVGVGLGCAYRGGMEDDTPAAPEEESNPSLETSGEIKKRPNEPVASMLESRFAGVNVTVNPDGSLMVRIRGAASFMASSDPLYVIDGIPVRSGPRGALYGLNPHDIESIKVLKSPPETTLYGVRGANGVVVITTKRPGP